MMVGRLLRRRSVDGGLAIAWGLSLLIVVGGVLNLARVISPVLVVSLVLAGLGGWLVFGGPHRLIRATRRLGAWDYLALAVLLVAYVNWLCFNARVDTEYMGYDLRLMYSVNDVKSIPTAGKELIIVADVNGVLYFRIFDGERMVVNTDEKKLKDRVQEIQDLRTVVESLRPPHELTKIEKLSVSSAVILMLGRFDYMIFMIDDSSYTLFPELMLRTGSMGVDPFNDRLTSTGLGGVPFLQTLILAIFPIEYIHLADPGLAYPAIGVMLLSGWHRRLTAPARAMLAMLFASVPTASINASAVAIPVVLLLAIVRELERARSGGPIRSGACVALLLAALLTLKTTFIPAGILLVFLRGTLLAVTTRRVRPLLEGIVTAVFLIVMLLPWMVFSSYSSGTLFYPVLGEGFRKLSANVMPHRTLTPRGSYGSLVRIVQSLQTLVMLVGLAAASVCVLFRKVSGPYRAAQLAGFGSCLFCLVLFTSAFGWMGHYWRYYYAIEAFADLIAYSALLRLIPAKGEWRYLRMAIFVILAGHILFYGSKAVLRSLELPEVIGAAFSGRTRFTTEEMDRYRRLQHSAPPGSPIFSIVDWPLLFDLGRNKFYYHDPYGNISAPPGIPLGREPEDIADYLRSLGLLYVACPAHEALRLAIDERAQQFRDTERSLEAPDWFLSLARAKVNFLESLDKLSRRYVRLYDDGRIMMIDLSTKVEGQDVAAATPPPRPTTTRGTSSAHVRSDPEHRLVVGEDAGPSPPR
jgi:hypothetical protein